MPSAHRFTRRFDGRALPPMHVEGPAYKPPSPLQRGVQPDRTLASQNQWFTKAEVAAHCVSAAQSVARKLGKRWGDYHFVEPSAGDGRFYELLPPGKRIGIDLSPQFPDVERHDFLTWSPPRPGLYAVIGNPPFGVRGDLARAFITRACMFADLCAFILPVSFMDEQRAYFPGYELAHREELPGDSFVNIRGHESKTAGQGAINTCFNVWSAGNAPRPPRFDYVCADHVRVAACNFPQDPAAFIKAHDVFIKARYYGGAKVSAKFDDVKSRRSHYVVGIKVSGRGRKTALAKIMQIDWSDYHTKAMNGSFSITLKGARRALHHIGLAEKVAKGGASNKPKNNFAADELTGIFGLDTLIGGFLARHFLHTLTNSEATKMKFDVYGPFELLRTNSLLVRRDALPDLKEQLAEEIDISGQKLADACGCYVFAIKARRGMQPWYVGKSERRDFSKECLNYKNITMFNELTHGRQGKPVLYLLPKLTQGGSFAQPTTSKPKPGNPIDFLENMLISMGIRRNPELANISKTKMLRTLEVMGFLNPQDGRRLAKREYNGDPVWHGAAGLRNLFKV